jgi:hypothetical protein
MADEPKPRAVSGEIMAGPQPSQPPIRDGGEDAGAIEADFETIGAAPARETAEPSSAPVPAGLDSLKSTSAPDRSGRGGAVFWSIGALAALVAFWISGGHALLTPDPADARTKRSVHPLYIENVVSRTEESGGRFVLFVEGDARNGSDASHALPAIDIAVTDNDGATQRYRLDTGRTELVPGQRYGFSSRLEAPKPGVRSVSVTFREEIR